MAARKMRITYMAAAGLTPSCTIHQLAGTPTDISANVVELVPGIYSVLVDRHLLVNTGAIVTWTPDAAGLELGAVEGPFGRA